jgi:hypothetical protein
MNNLEGKRFGRLIVVSRTDDQISKNGKHRVRWLCKCDCGSTVKVISDSLLQGSTKSCGCFRKESSSKRNSTHHDSESRLYNVWCAVKSRCYNPNSTFYEYYGGRGISICDEWRNSYEAFKQWALENGYVSGAGLSIDRIDFNGNYEPSNCRWVDRFIQAGNRRSCRIYTYNNETHNIADWAKETGIPYKRLHSRLYFGWDIERALTTT